MSQEYAYLTGGASGIGRAVAQMLADHKIRVFIVDRDLDGAQRVVHELAQTHGQGAARCAQVDVADWTSQVAAFSQAVGEFGRVDYVFPIAGVGERPSIINDPSREDFFLPDLTVINVDLTGVIYTVALAVQQFRKQAPGHNGFRGKIVSVASVCGFYAVPTMPIYSAAKHGVVGLTRSYGQYLPEEKITMNAVCPSVVQTNIVSIPGHYESLEAQGLLTPIKGVVETFEKLLGSDPTSGECFEIGPNYHMTGPVPRRAPDYLDEESGKVCEMLRQRLHVIHEPR